MGGASLFYLPTRPLQRDRITEGRMLLAFKARRTGQRGLDPQLRKGAKNAMNRIGGLAASRLQKASGMNRIVAIDFLRGFAMVLVILDHTFQSVNPVLIQHWFYKTVTLITALAAIGFVAISGTIFSYFLYAKEHWQAVYARYARRAAFLLLLVHPAINLMDYFWQWEGVAHLHGVALFVRKIVIGFPITDTIALCILVTPLLMVRVSNGARMGIVLVLLVLSRAVCVSYHPETIGTTYLKEAIFGIQGEARMFWYGLLPWVAVFLAGSFIARSLVQFKKGALDRGRFVHILLRMGMGLVVLGGFLACCSWGIKRVWGARLSGSMLLGLSTNRLSTLLPAYLGVLVLLLGIMLQWVDVEGNFNRLVWMVCVFGRTSLFVYVGQFAVVESAPALLGLKGVLGPAGFFALFSIGLVVMWLAAYGYGRLRGWISPNDYIENVSMVRLGCANQ
jgi:uncharacterized membrane protein